MRQLNDPPSGLERRILFNQFLLFASWSDVGDESIRHYSLLFAHICCIEAEILRSVLFFWCNHSVFQQRVKRDAVVPIGPADDAGNYDVLFNNKLGVVVPTRIVDKILEKIKPSLQYDRRGGLYCAEVKLSSFPRPALKQ